MRCRVCGPMSRIASPAGHRQRRRCRPGASGEVATTTSVGRITATPRLAAAARISFAVPTRSASTSDVPTPTPWASRNVLAIPPTSTTVSARVARDCSVSSLPEILAPPTTATNGRSGLSRTFVSAAISRAISGPAARSGKCAATPGRGGVGAVGGAERVVDVDVGERRQLRAERRVVLLLAGLEPQVLQQQHIAGLCLRHRLLRRLADHVRDEPHGPADVLLEDRRHRREGKRRVGLALGAPEVRAGDDDRAPLGEGAHRRGGLPHPGVVQHPPVLERER